jgi:hypothetical protein
VNFSPVAVFNLKKCEGSRNSLILFTEPRNPGKGYWLYTSYRKCRAVTGSDVTELINVNIKGYKMTSAKVEALPHPTTTLCLCVPTFNF